MAFDKRLTTPESERLTVSVVVATYNRARLLRDLLDALTRQTLPDQFELVLVDDGSAVPVRPIVDSFTHSLKIKFIEQTNAGQASARDRGVREASGDVVVVLDDDMEFPEEFLERHLAWHQLGYRVVLGRILSSKDVDKMPLFERFHADQLNQFAESMMNGEQPRGTHLCTGNVSFRRDDYIAIGGFDKNLRRSEDRDLGIRLEALGAKFIFGFDAPTIHDSDHVNLDVWLGRAYNYGVYDSQISKKHPNIIDANPWRYFYMVSPISRPLVLAVTAFPKLGKKLTTVAWRLSELCDNSGLHTVAIKGATLVYGLEYFRGMRAEAGSLKSALRDLLTFSRKSSKS